MSIKNYFFLKNFYLLMKRKSFFFKLSRKDNLFPSKHQFVNLGQQ